MKPRVHVVLCAWFLAVISSVAQEGGWSGFGEPPAVNRGQPAGKEPALDALELRGISQIGSSIQFNLVDSRSKQGFWVPLGGTVKEFTVVSFDQASGVVKVRLRAATADLRMVAPKIGTLKPAPTLVAAQGAAGGTSASQVQGVDEIRNPKTPAEIKQAETEARMMVSDLLEISMRERQKAREAKKKQQEQGQAQR